MSCVVSALQVLEAMDFAVYRDDIQHIVIDNLQVRIDYVAMLLSCHIESFRYTGHAFDAVHVAATAVQR
jgi:hypothetical protein